MKENNSNLIIAEVAPDPISDKLLNQGRTPLVVLICRTAQSADCPIELQNAGERGVWHLDYPVIGAAGTRLFMEDPSLEHEWWRQLRNLSPEIPSAGKGDVKMDGSIALRDQPLTYLQERLLASDDYAV
jgi:hypothetical protein